MPESTLPGRQTTSSKAADGTDKSAQTGKPASNDHLLEPFLSQTPASAANTNGLDQLSKTQTDWTVIADMSILFDQQDVNGRHMGAEDKTALLKELKNNTKDHSVSIVIQSITQDGKEVAPGTKVSPDDPKYGVKTIVLRDGQEYDISSGPSKGLKNDLQDELDFALKNQPSKHVALAISAHGLGDEGILGGSQDENGKKNGQIKTANELADTIKSSLTKANHDKLDVVDMDSCLMGQMGVLHSMSGVTKNLVASEQTEIVSAAHGVDGQNLNAWILDIIGNSKMGGTEVARDIVAKAEARQNDGDGRGSSGTATLASYDLSHIDEFSDLMNKLGKALTNGSKNADENDAIKRAILNTTNFDAQQDHGPPVNASDAKYDLKQFLGRLKSTMGSTSDPELSKAMDDVTHYVDDRSKLVSAIHEPPAIGLGRFGTAKLAEPVVSMTAGLSIYLPNDQIRTNSKLTKEFVDNLGTMETGTTDSDWSKFLSSMWKPVQPFGTLNVPIAKPAQQDNSSQPVRSFPGLVVHPALPVQPNQ